jgi:hypothetical protein
MSGLLRRRRNGPYAHSPPSGGRGDPHRICTHLSRTWHLLAAAPATRARPPIEAGLMGGGLTGITGVLLLAAWLGGCATYPHTRVEGGDIIMATAEIPEQQLLDVGIQTFDTGVEADAPTGEDGVFPEIRKAESRYIPYRLKRTLQESGQWGAIWVAPTATHATDLQVRGGIVESNGERLVLKIDVTDAAGRNWLHREYEASADVEAYGVAGEVRSAPFQHLYNTIANDMLVAEERLTAVQRTDIRRVAAMRYAGDLAPYAFRDYLRYTKQGMEIDRLPAPNDPMMARLMQIREREYMLLDTLNERYALFCDEMQDPYDNWRSFSHDEAVSLRELRQSARFRQLLGAAAVIGAIALDANGSSNRSALRDLMLIGGIATFKSGMDKNAEAKIHADALEELGSSFESEVAPIVVDVEGRTVKLTGSIETQYEQWRQLLREIYVAETGFQPEENETPSQHGDP